MITTGLTLSQIKALRRKYADNRWVRAFAKEIYPYGSDLADTLPLELGTASTSRHGVKRYTRPPKGDVVVGGPIEWGLPNPSWSCADPLFGCDDNDCLVLR